MGEDAYKVTLCRACLSWWKERAMRKGLAADPLQVVAVYQETVTMDADAVAKEFVAWLDDYHPRGAQT